MDPELKAKWVDALRSGEYPQAQQVLVAIDKDSNEPTGYCCLGVLCKVRGMLDKDIEKLGQRTDQMGYQVEIEPDGYFDGSPEIGEHLGLSVETRERLAALNDGEFADGSGPWSTNRSYKVLPKTFAEIADYIEQKL